MENKRISRLCVVFIALGVLSGTSWAQPDDGEIEQIVKKRKVSLQLPTGQLPSHQPQQVISLPFLNDPQWSFLGNPPRAQNGRPLFFPMPPHNESQKPPQTHEVLIPQPLWDGQSQRPSRNGGQQSQEALVSPSWWREVVQRWREESMQQSVQQRTLTHIRLCLLNGQQTDRLLEPSFTIMRQNRLPLPVLSVQSDGHRQEIFKKPWPKKKLLPTQGVAFKRVKDLP